MEQQEIYLVYNPFNPKGIRLLPSTASNLKYQSIYLFLTQYEPHIKSWEEARKKGFTCKKYKITL